MTSGKAGRGVTRDAAIVAAAIAITFAVGISGPFVFDDYPAIVDNQTIRRAELSSMVSPPRDSPTAARPVVNLSFALNYATSGLDVRAYHATNIAIHLACALLILGLVRRTTASPELALAVALLWAVHPLTTEPVDYVTQRSESLMALCYLMTLYAAMRAHGARYAAWSFAAVVACAIGIGCKESMVTAPVMVVAYDRAFAYDSLAEAFRRRGRLYAALGTTWLILIALLWSAPRAHSAGFSTIVTPWTYALNQPSVIGRYLCLTIWPRSLVLNYGPPRTPTVRDVAGAALFVAALLALAIVLFRRDRRLAFLGIWCVVTLAPASSFVPIATEVGAERRMYLPLVGIVVLAAVALRACNRRALVPVAVVVSIALSAASIARSREYQSALSLAQADLAHRASSTAHLMVGTELLAVGERENGEWHLREAARELPKARYALGIEVVKDGRPAEGIELLESFVRDEPWTAEALPARHVIGEAYAIQHDWPRAVAEFQQILTIAPGSVDAAEGLADALFAQQAFDAAIVHYRDVLRIRPADRSALGRVGIAFAATGRSDEALAAFARAVALAPDDAEARRNLATARLDRQETAEAVRQAKAAVAIAPGNAAGHDLLGRALALQGRFADAEAELQRAVELDPHDVHTRDDLREVRRVRACRAC